MKYLLICSLLLNLWFQFGENIFDSYVRFTYCKNSSVESFQFGEYEILGFNFLHINHIIEPYDGYSTVTCSDGTNNKRN